MIMDEHVLIGYLSSLAQIHKDWGASTESMTNIASILKLAYSNAYTAAKLVLVVAECECIYYYNYAWLCI